MEFQKLFVVTGFAILLIGWMGLGIIDDMFLLARNLRRPPLRLLNIGKQLIFLGNSLRRKPDQLLRAFNFEIAQKQQSL